MSSLNLNKVMVTGRLTRDPETKYLPSGAAVATLGLAINRPFQDKNGEWKQETIFIDVETWSKLAERCSEGMKKGDQVYVEGRLKQETWERDGQKRSAIKIVADVAKAFGRDTGKKAEAAADDGPKASDGLDFSNPHPGVSLGNKPTDDFVPF